MPADEINNVTAATAWMQARLCAECAERASNDDERRQFIHMRDSWIQAANDMQLTNSVKRARRLRARRASPR
jgi:hypothetical protein